MKNVIAKLGGPKFLIGVGVIVVVIIVALIIISGGDPSGGHGHEH